VDGHEAGAWQYADQATPNTMFVDSQGRWRGQYEGELDAGRVRDALGKPIDPSAWNDGSDGFSAGTAILAYVPGLTKNADLAPSRLPTDTEIARELAAPLALVDEVRSLRRGHVVLLDADGSVPAVGFGCHATDLSIEDRLTLQPHPASCADPESYAYPLEIEVVGQVTQVAMTLGRVAPRPTRS